MRMRQFVQGLWFLKQHGNDPWWYLPLYVHIERTRPVPGISVMNSMKHFVGLAAGMRLSSLMSEYKLCSFWCLSVMTKLQLCIPRSPVILFVCYIWTLYANPLWLINAALWRLGIALVAAWSSSNYL